MCVGVCPGFFLFFLFIYFNIFDVFFIRILFIYYGCVAVSLPPPSGVCYLVGLARPVRLSGGWWWWSSSSWSWSPTDRRAGRVGCQLLELSHCYCTAYLIDHCKLQVPGRQWIVHVLLGIQSSTARVNNPRRSSGEGWSTPPACQLQLQNTLVHFRDGVGLMFGLIYRHDQESNTDRLVPSRQINHKRCETTKVPFPSPQFKSDGQKAGVCLPRLP